MKIAVISGQAFTLTNFRGPLLIEMVRRGHDVVAFAPDFNAQSRAALAEIGVTAVDYKMQRTGVNPLQELRSLIDLYFALRNHRPDLCFSYTIKPVIYGTLAAWAAGVKLKYGLIEGLGFAFTRTKNFNFFKNIIRFFISNMMKIVTSLLDKILFLNRDDVNDFINFNLVKPNKTAILGAIGLDLQEWVPTPFPPLPVTFILIARLLRDKGVGEYIEAIKILRAQNVGARFLLLGAIDENPSAFSRAEVQDWVDSGLVEWHGHVPVGPWIAQSHVFVLPSYREGVPRSTQEAMAMGRAVITTDSPGCRETVSHGRNGFLVAPRDAAALAGAMRQMIETPEIIAKMGQEGRIMAQDRFDVHVQNARLLQLMGVFSWQDM